MLVCPHCSKDIDLVGTKEGAAILGVSTSTFQGFRERDDFPKPRAVLGQGGLWLRQDLLDWQERRKHATVEKLVLSLEQQLADLPEGDRQVLVERLLSSQEK